MTSYFKLKRITDIKAVNESTQIVESDFSLFTSDDKFVQFDLVEQEKQEERVKAKPGIFVIAVKNHDMVMQPSGFTKENVLADYLNTRDIGEKIDKFFQKVDVYKDLGIFPKRAALLYGSPGCGKSQLLSQVANEYTKNGDTLALIWPTDKFEARHVKDFLRTFDYGESVKKLILIMEDLGGTEVTGRGQQASESSLLALLDNVEMTFTIPTMILATTNYPENFLENLTNRPQRFDDLIEVKRPSGDFRAAFLEFFASKKIDITDDIKKYIASKEFDDFSVAHVKECVVRALIYDLTITEAINQVRLQSNTAKSDFTNRKKMGF